MTIYAIFESIHCLMKAEKALRQEKFRFDLKPNPTELKTSCGMSISFSPEGREEAERIIASALPSSSMFAFYIRTDNEFRKL